MIPIHAQADVLYFKLVTKLPKNLNGMPNSMHYTTGSLATLTYMCR